MMEKYGAEVERYEVVKVVAFDKEAKETLGTDLTLEEAKELAEQNKDAMVKPMR